MPIRVAVAVRRDGADPAAARVLGADSPATRQRGRLYPGPGGAVLTATVHPSSILRAPSEADRVAARAFHDDLRLPGVLIRDGPLAALERASKPMLLEFARRLDLSGRSSMTEALLVQPPRPARRRAVEAARTVGLRPRCDVPCTVR